LIRARKFSEFCERGPLIAGRGLIDVSLFDPNNSFQS
jgi:hypothetical protein